MTSYFNPRAWDESVLKQADDNSVFRTTWQRFQSLVVGIDLQPGIVAEVVMHYDSTDAAKLWTEFVRKSDGSPEFLGRVPKRAIAGFAGRYDPQAIATLLLHAASDRKQKQLGSFRQVSQGLLLGLDVFDDVLPEMRSNWGMFFVTREPLKHGVIPFDGLVAFQLPNVAADKQSSQRTATVRAALDNGLNTALNLLAAYYNGKSTNEAIAIVRSDRPSSAVIRWIESVGAYQPAYALTADYLIFSSTPSLISEFMNATADERMTASSQLPLSAANGDQVMFVNFAALREFLEDNKEFFIAHAAESRSTSEESIKKQLERVDELIGLVDTGFVSVNIGDDQIRLVLGGLLDDRAGDR